MYTPVNKSKENNFPTTRQESRAVANSIGQKKSNEKQLSRFIDKRASNIEHKSLQLRTSPNVSKILQFFRSVKHSPVNFTFDSNGTKTRPVPPGTTTNPVGRSFWPNQMITANLITHNNNTANYQSGHQIAHRFNGSDDGDNVAAWPDVVEANYSVEENRIDNGLASTRENENGKLNVTTGYQSSGVVINDMVNECVSCNLTHLQDTSNWDNLNSGSTNAHPTSNPSETELYDGLYNLFNTQQYQVTDGHVAATVEMKYEAKDSKTGNSNPSRSFSFSDYSIKLPSWTNTGATWLTYLRSNKPRISNGGENFRLNDN